MARANELLTPEEMKEISCVPSHEMVSQHIHKLVQVIFSCLVFYLFHYYYFFKCLAAFANSSLDGTFYC